MSTATFTPILGTRPGGSPRPKAAGATATSASRSRHRVGSVLHAAKVFAATAVSVVVLGEYAEDAGVIRR